MSFHELILLELDDDLKEQAAQMTVPPKELLLVQAVRYLSKIAYSTNSIDQDGVVAHKPRDDW